MNPKKLLTVELKTWYIKGKYKVLQEKKIRSTINTF